MAGEVWRASQGAVLNLLCCVAGIYRVHLTPPAFATCELMYVGPN
jgi:hypothetical protein